MAKPKRKSHILWVSGVIAAASLVLLGLETQMSVLKDFLPEDVHRALLFAIALNNIYIFYRRRKTTERLE